MSRKESIAVANAPPNEDSPGKGDRREIGENLSLTQTKREPEAARMRTNAPLVISDPFTGRNPISVTAADLNVDGHLDLAVAHDVGGVSVLFGKGDGTLQAAINYVASAGPSSVAAGDFNGDGQLDLAVANLTDSVSILLNACVSDRLDLAATRNANNFIVSWPFPSTGFVLETTPSLSPANWQPALEVPRTNAARLEITAPVNLGQSYFRLHKQ